jgi:cytochrome o ubiquinol oxidase subunit II
MRKGITVRDLSELVTAAHGDVVLRSASCWTPAKRLAVICVSFVGLSGCSSGILDPNGPVGTAEKTILIDSLAIMLAIVVPTILAILGFAWWFRASNTRARYLPDWSYSGQIEMVVWGIPLLVILLLGGVAWISAHELDPAKPLASRTKPVEIQVVSLDWKWLFIYPAEGVASLNRLVVPAGVPLHLSLTSASVMNVFFVPQLGSMIYTMNGMATELNLQADNVGVLPGLAAHFNGDGFSDMHFDVEVVSAGEFADWARKAGATNNVLDARRYGELTQQSAHVAPEIFKLGDAGLYASIVTQKLPPGPGPQIGRPTPSVSPRSGDPNAR